MAQELGWSVAPSSVLVCSNSAGAGNGKTVDVDGYAEVQLSFWNRVKALFNGSLLKKMQDESTKSAGFVTFYSLIKSSKYYNMIAAGEQKFTVFVVEDKRLSREILNQQNIDSFVGKYIVEGEHNVFDIRMGETLGLKSINGYPLLIKRERVTTITVNGARISDYWPTNTGWLYRITALFT